MSLRGPLMKRSQSASNVHQASLGQGAVVVRTPADATMHMAKSSNVARSDSQRGQHRTPQANVTSQVTSQPVEQAQVHLMSPSRTPRAAPTPTAVAGTPALAAAHRVTDTPPLLQLNVSPLDFDTDKYQFGTYNVPSPPAPPPSAFQPKENLDAMYAKRYVSRMSSGTPATISSGSSAASSPRSPPPHPTRGHAPKASVGYMSSYYTPASTNSSISSNYSHSHKTSTSLTRSASTTASITASVTASNNANPHRPSNEPRGPLAAPRSTPALREAVTVTASVTTTSAAQAPARPMRPQQAPPPPRALARASTLPTRHGAMPSQATIHEAEPAVAASQAQPIQSKSQGLHHTQAQPAQTQTPFAPILLDQKTRAVHGPSNVLVNLRFAFSLDENPNTHEITVTLDTLRPAGGRLLAFIDHLLRPQSLESETSPDDMTEGSSAEESDLEGFEYDNRDSIMQTEYLEELKFGSALQITPTMPNMPSLPSLKDLSSRMAGARERQAVQYTDGGNTAPLSIRGRAHRPRSSTIHAPVPAGVARGTPFTRAPAPTHDSHMSPISPADVSESVTANIIQGNDTLTELWILLQRDAAAWHTIAARLCSGSWPEMAGRRRRVENECRWAGMESLLDELAAMPSSLRGRGGFL